ncbi:Uma2 family endonuclease [Salinibacter ruber]|nr:Uma2 family endonuclease [Salinibacter ruber]
MKETGDPTTLAPEICVEVMSESNDWEEMEEKADLYRKAGAEEVWIVDGEEKVHFIAEEEMEGSEIAPGFPRSV